MKFTIEPKDLNAAIGLVSIVAPEGAGYLFSVHGNICNIYSRNAEHVVRAQAPITDVEGEGDFIYPSTVIDAFKYLDTAITIEAVEEEGRFLVRHSTVDGDAGEHSSVDPKLVASCEEDLQTTGEGKEFPARILQMAIASVRPYLAEPDANVQEYYKTMQLFDDSKPDWAAGDGVLFAANNVRAAYFECSAFKGKSLAIYCTHVPYVLAYLAKAGGTVRVHDSAHMTYMVDEKANVLGFVHNASAHAKYFCYALEKDQYIFNIGIDAVLRPLQYIKAELAKDRDKIRISYLKETGQFKVAQSKSVSKSHSRPVPVKQCVQAEDASFAANFNIDHALGLFDSARGNEVQLRAFVIRKGTKENALFRTVDHFWVDASGKLTADATAPGVVECKVTRFVPSKD